MVGLVDRITETRTVRHSRRRALKLWTLAIAVVAAGSIVVGVAAAANSVTLTDDPNDNPLGPDVSSVVVSSDDAGTVTVRVTAPNRLNLGAGDEIGLDLDVDQNPETGTVFYGTDVTIEFDRGVLRSLLAAPSGYFQEGARPASVTGTLDNGVATFSFKAADLGIKTGFNFVVDTFSHLTGGTDTAPEIRTINYQLVAGTPPPVVGPDTRAPIDTALSARGKRGPKLFLDYFAQDNRGQTSDTVRVYKGRKVIKTVRYRLQDTNPFFVYYARWKAPKKAKGKYRFCVSSVDMGGNKSNTDCAAISLR
jgi:hypothetical protein